MMATQLADAELLDPPKDHPPIARSQTIFEPYVAEEEGRSLASRGIVIAMLISLPFWALIAFTIFLLS